MGLEFTSKKLSSLLHGGDLWYKGEWLEVPVAQGHLFSQHFSWQVMRTAPRVWALRAQGWASGALEILGWVAGCSVCTFPFNCCTEGTCGVCAGVLTPVVVCLFATYM